MTNIHTRFDRHKIWVIWSVLIVLVTLFSLSNTAIAGDKNSVLYISSYHPGFPTFFQQIDGVKSVFGESILLDIEFMDTKRYPQKENWRIFHDTLTYKLGSENTYDVIMVADDNALVYALEQQDQLFHDKPIVFLGVNNIHRALDQNKNPNMTGVVESVSMEDTIKLMIKLRPKSSQIVALVDGTVSGQGDLKLFYQVAKEVSSHDFKDLSLAKMTWPDFLKSVGDLGEESAVLLLSAYKDQNNISYLFDEAVRQINESSRVPVFHLWRHGLGQGILGGKIISHYEQGKVAATLVQQILNGTSVEQIEVVNSSPNKYVFDYVELKKWGIHQSGLPENSIILNEPRSFYREYKTLIWTVAVVIILLSLALLFAVVNIFKRKAAEAGLARANIDLSAKNEELEQVVYVASHDLRSPLVNIDGYSKELEYAVKELNDVLDRPSLEDVSKELQPILDEDIPESLRFIRTSAGKMDVLLSGLLRLSRSGRAALNIQTLDMNNVVSKVLESMEFKIKKAGVQLVVQDLPPCRSDTVQTDQIFTNLLDNAIKCLDPGGRTGVIKISGKMAGNRSEYCVEDNGVGIDKNHLNKIFEIFHQLAPEQNNGDGLGLTIVKRILFRLDGSIRVESEPGAGSRFFVSLPKD